MNAYMRFKVSKKRGAKEVYDFLKRMMDDIDWIENFEVGVIDEKQLRTSAVSSQHQTQVIREVRSILGLEKGDRVAWILCNGQIIVRKAEK